MSTTQTQTIPASEVTRSEGRATRELQVGQWVRTYAWGRDFYRIEAIEAMPRGSRRLQLSDGSVRTLAACNHVSVATDR